jgi:signal transduction histidine kinase/CheY-like chemotaxis protein
MSSDKQSRPHVRDVAEHEIDWRTQLFLRIRWIVIIVVLLAANVILFSGSSDALYFLGFGAIASSTFIIGPLWSSRISVRVRSNLLIAALAAVTVACYIAVGYLPGSSLTGCLVLVVTVLLKGRNAFIGVLAAFLLFLVGLAAAVAAGWWAGPAYMDVTPADSLNWLRTGLVTVLLWAALGFSVLFVVDSIETNLARRRLAHETLRKEVAERQAAEEARRNAEVIATQAQKMEVVGKLVAGIAHDFNNALLVIRGWNEVRGNLDSEKIQRDATEAIEKAADHTTQLSRQLLTYTRKDLIAPRYFYLDQLVEQTVKTFENLVDARIKVFSEVQQGLVVFADESQLQQTLYNLMINARDAIPEKGSIRVSAKTARGDELDEQLDAAREWVVLSVEDDGAGINEELQSAIFEPFFTTKAPGSGTGLGLSTVASIVERNQGHIRLSSEPGHTVFSIYLRLEDMKPSCPADYVAESDARLSGLRVLVLEDDALARQFIVTVLESRGCEVIECVDGNAALAQLKNNMAPFDIACVDAVFPGADLEDVVKALEQNSPGCKILICSGYVDQEQAIKKVASGEYAFLAKPFSGATLASKIREVCGQT